MIRFNLVVLTLLCTFGLGNVAQAQMAAPPKPIAVTTMGSSSMLTGAGGMTLYIEDTDVGGKSVCNGPCAVNWPPLAAPADAKPVGLYTIITRDDGSLQWAYNGKPLYYWKNDKQPGDTTGDGVAGRWHVAKP
jgi:predicted lipoprotein with Yx(FWY)xxD motif